MIDLYLKAASEEEMNSELIKAGFRQDDERGSVYYEGVCIDTIGIIYKGTGKMIESDGIQYEEQAPIDGWHVNLRVIADDDPIIAKLEHIRTYAKTPVRVWV